MTDETVVAVFDTAAHAEAAVSDLKNAGVPADMISVHAGPIGAGTTTTMTMTNEPVREEGFWANLFGGQPDHDTAVYDRSMEGGSTVVTVKASEAYVERVMEVLESHHPIDIDERASGYGFAATTAATRNPVIAPETMVSPVTAATTSAGVATGDEETLRLAEETLEIGKRVVNRGTTRIRRFVVETPVEKSISLHSEKVVLERRPVTDARPITDASFTDKTIEMTESSEEAVVSKTAHVYEEVGLRKEATERVETVRDTVRKEDVEIEKVPGTVGAATTSGTTLPPKV